MAQITIADCDLRLKKTINQIIQKAITALMKPTSRNIQNTVQLAGRGKYESLSFSCLTSEQQVDKLFYLFEAQWLFYLISITQKQHQMYIFPTTAATTKVLLKFSGTI